MMFGYYLFKNNGIKTSPAIQIPICTMTNHVADLNIKVLVKNIKLQLKVYLLPDLKVQNVFCAV